ncbi:uncharacterized protein TRIVIDRAFT_61111 [Trichoderma virens Gv29-8]|uniref:Uncharacterized protein n=1 Tax=Hypocrea virens (strain Gv29-8 / FGSC 10586) TaxID=413071 RepID=G9MLT8_HYPVG|nr:uncharacterized protein TRIVIDRAFT_61111 [Trichoderma virens Gv29-8]EHK24312.1 hypothetical protein TRIVIDRAFT_61111 [Trichoderma virens Gv29-8]
MPQSGLVNSASLHQGEAKRVPGLALSEEVENKSEAFLRSLIRELSFDDSLMSEGGDERRGSGDDFLVRQWMFGSILDSDGDGNENVSETSTLLPTSRRPSSLAHVEDGGRNRDEEGGEQGQGPRRRRRESSRRRLLCEEMLRVGMLVATVAVVGLTVVRALKGKFSPGLLAGGGLMMVMCILVNKRELRGQLAAYEYDAGFRL